MGLISRVSSRTYRNYLKNDGKLKLSSSNALLEMTTYIRNDELESKIPNDDTQIDEKPTLTQIRNPLTGKFEWQLNQPDHDFSTELSISHYCDMLHDIERNELYRKAIEKTVKHMLKNGQQVDVLDIGTGTGLLAMFACKVDKSVKARGIEVFPPVAKIARKCIAKNGLMKQIEVIETRNTDLEETVRKSNLIVTELFDTELIGEGCLESYAWSLE